MRGIACWVCSTHQSGIGISVGMHPRDIRQWRWISLFIKQRMAGRRCFQILSILVCQECSQVFIRAQESGWNALKCIEVRLGISIGYVLVRPRRGRLGVTSSVGSTWPLEVEEWFVYKSTRSPPMPHPSSIFLSSAVQRCKSTQHSTSPSHSHPRLFASSSPWIILTWMASRNWQTGGISTQC